MANTFFVNDPLGQKLIALGLCNSDGDLIGVAASGTPDDNSVSTVKVQDAAITAAKMAGPIPLLAADPGVPVDNTCWFTKSGTTAGSTINLNLRIAGATIVVPIATLT